jgi:hypothetical protein
MEVETDNIIALISLLVGSFVFYSSSFTKNLSVTKENKQKFLEKELIKKKKIKNDKVKKKDKINKFEELYNSLWTSNSLPLRTNSKKKPLDEPIKDLINFSSNIASNITKPIVNTKELSYTHNQKINTKESLISKNEKITRQDSPTSNNKQQDPPLVEIKTNVNKYDDDDDEKKGKDKREKEEEEKHEREKKKREERENDNDDEENDNDDDDDEENDDDDDDENDDDDDDDEENDDDDDDDEENDDDDDEEISYKYLQEHCDIMKVKSPTIAIDLEPLLNIDGNDENMRIAIIENELTQTKLKNSDFYNSLNLDNSNDSIVTYILNKKPDIDNKNSFLNLLLDSEAFIYTKKTLNTMANNKIPLRLTRQDNVVEEDKIITSEYKYDNSKDPESVKKIVKLLEVIELYLQIIRDKCEIEDDNEVDNEVDSVDASEVDSDEAFTEATSVSTMTSRMQQQRSPSSSFHSNIPGTLSQGNSKSSSNTDETETLPSGVFSENENNSTLSQLQSERQAKEVASAEQLAASANSSSNQQEKKLDKELEEKSVAASSNQSSSRKQQAVKLASAAKLPAEVAATAMSKKQNSLQSSSSSRSSKQSVLESHDSKQRSNTSSLTQTQNFKYKTPVSEGGEKFDSNLKTILVKGGSTLEDTTTSINDFINKDENNGIIKVSRNLPILDDLNSLSPLLILIELDDKNLYYNDELLKYYTPLFGIQKNNEQYIPNPNPNEKIDYIQLLYIINLNYIGLDSVNINSNSLNKIQIPQDTSVFESSDIKKLTAPATSPAATSISAAPPASTSTSTASTASTSAASAPETILQFEENKIYKANKEYYSNLDSDNIIYYLKTSYSPAGAGYYNYNDKFDNSFKNLEVYERQYNKLHYYPIKETKQPIYNFIIPLIIFKMYRIILYKKLLKNKEKFIFQNIFIDFISSFILIIVLFILGLNNVASILFTDLLSSIVIIYLFLFTYDEYIKNKNKINIEYIINILILIPYFVMYL